jgi:Tol biopolymer transport system component
MSRPALSPDGRILAFEWRSSIWTVPVEGGEAVLIAPSPDRRSSPVWSPDGTSIACVATDPEYRSFFIQILRANSAGPVRELWRTSSEIKGTLDWSPSGEEIALSLGPDERLAALPTAGGGPRFLGFNGVHPRWSPDGALLAYQTANNRDLWMVSLKTGNRERLATDISVNSSFCWSPDGKEIVYESLDRQSVDLWKVSAAGGRAVPLTNDIALEQGPRWHPSNGHIYFSHRRRIWRVSKVGGPMEQVPIICQLSKREEPNSITAFKGADVVDVIGGRILHRQTVLVRQGRIENIGPNLLIPRGAKIIDVAGKFAVPGLMDMHVHYLP